MSAKLERPSLVSERVIASTWVQSNGQIQWGRGCEGRPESSEGSAWPKAIECSAIPFMKIFLQPHLGSGA